MNANRTEKNVFDKKNTGCFLWVSQSADLNSDIYASLYITSITIALLLADHDSPQQPFFQYTIYSTVDEVPLSANKKNNKFP